MSNVKWYASTAAFISKCRPPVVKIKDGPDNMEASSGEEAAYKILARPIEDSLPKVAAT
jgi:hypothetical protein